MHFQKQLNNTQTVFCQTAIMKERLERQLGYRGNINVCGSAVSSDPAGGNEPINMPESLKGLESKFKFIYLTRYYPHKNIEKIIEVFQRYPQGLEEAVVVLTIDKDQHPNAAKILKEIASSGLQDKVINVGPIPPDQVMAYYKHCQALLMPTLLESFGIPYLEAMQAEIPIITSDLDFARGQCGDAALYFDPWDTKSIHETMVKLLGSDHLRTNLALEGKKRLNANFKSWGEITKNIIKSLEETASFAH